MFFLVFTNWLANLQITESSTSSEVETIHPEHHRLWHSQQKHTPLTKHEIVRSNKTFGRAIRTRALTEHRNVVKMPVSVHYLMHLFPPNWAYQNLSGLLNIYSDPKSKRHPLKTIFIFQLLVLFLSSCSWKPSYLEFIFNV